MPFLVSPLIKLADWSVIQVTYDKILLKEYWCKGTVALFIWTSKEDINFRDQICFMDINICLPESAHEDDY